MTQREILQLKVEARVLTYLHRVRCFYERSLYGVVGRGVTPEEYTEVINKLVDKGILTRTIGMKDAPILQWIEKSIEVTGHGTNNLNH